jgi:hypothetical protein
MRRPVSTRLARAECGDAPKPARAIRETRTAFVPSKSAQADLEPRHSLPSGERRPMSSPRLLGGRRPERRSASKPVITLVLALALLGIKLRVERRSRRGIE